MLLVKTPVPVPFIVWLSITTGLWDIFQHTPRALTGSPPSELILPSLDAEVGPIDPADVVISTGKDEVGPFSLLISF